jgi:hypothetical protein
MTGTNAGSARILGEQCRKNTIHGNPSICLINVVEILNSLDNFDLIGLQESANWDIIYNKLINKNLKYIHSKYGIVNIVIFYNCTKIKIIAIKSGIFNIDPNNIRPYQIIFCYDLISNKYLIFINLHNGHGKNYIKDKLQDKFNINENIMKILDDGNNNYLNCQLYETDKYNDIKEYFDNDINIIMVGDFNDYGENFFSGFKPFEKTSLKIKDIEVSTNNLKPENTCCDVLPFKNGKIPYDSKNYNRYGDYILFSNNLIPFINNKIYNLDPSKLYSDHLPIFSILNYKDDIFKNKYLKYKKKYINFKKRK